jgi:3-methyladenine DNA glycosylase/8-oxoguanine DNA glycosylase
VSARVLVDESGYAASAAFASIAAPEVPGLERASRATGSYERLVAVGGHVALVSAAFSAERVRVTAQWPDGDGEGDGQLRRLLRQWLDLETDLATVEQHLSEDEALAGLVRRQAGLRIVGSLDGFASAVMTVIGQQVSLAAGRTFGARLVARWGEPHPSGLVRFPSPETLARVDPVELAAAVGLTGRRSQTVVQLAQVCAAWFVVEPGGDVEAIRAALLAVPGIGPWTVDYLSLRVLRDADALPAGDLVLRRALGLRTATEVTRRAAMWSPYRAYAVSHLWHDAAYADARET